MDIENKLAIVTGVSKGIGYATVKDLLKKGAVVAGWGRSPADIDHEKFHYFSVDVSSEDSVNNGYKKTIEKLGNEIEILVNNAGLGFESSFEKTSTDHWKQMFSTNVDGIFYCSRLVIPKMKEMDSGHIINVASLAGKNGIPKMAGYCATKHAVRGLSQSMYKELRNFGIKVTCIFPGSVKTNFFDQIDSVNISDHMMMPEDISSTIIHCIESSSNYHHVEIEVRPLKPKG